MATQTPNLGLTLPVGTENVSRQVINGNNTLIDTFAGNVNTAMDQMGSNLGILETGDTATHAIAKGEYVTWKGASYTADAAISIGETLAATGGSKNLTACDKGIANALNSNFNNVLTTYPLKLVKATDYHSTEFGVSSFCVLVPGTIAQITASFDIYYKYLQAKYAIYVNGVKTNEWTKGANTDGNTRTTWSQQINIPSTGASVFVGISPTGDGGGSQAGSVTFS